MSNVTPFRRRGAHQPDLAGGRGGGMVIIAVASHGSGTGRTMLAAHIAVQAETTGDGPVGILDIDPKGDLFQWWTRRHGKMESPAFGARCDLNSLTLTMESMAAAGARLCVIDTAAGDAASLAYVAAVADLIVIPCDIDMASAGEAAALGRELSRQATIAFVANCRTHAGGEPGNALSAISSGGGWPAGTVQHSRAYAIAMTAGRTVTESDAGSEAAQDIAELWTTLRGILVAG
jgi:chromosome partitioning protein